MTTVSKVITKLIKNGKFDKALYQAELDKHGVDINNILVEFDGSTVSPFFLAIYHNKINCVRTLIEMGADVNNSLYPERNRINEKPLEFAAIMDTTDIARLLIESGADATFTQGSHSPIFHAIQNNNLDLTRILVESGADINHIDSNYYYNKLPLIHYAIHFRTFDMVKLLIELGANLKIKNNDGETPLMFAIKLKEAKFLTPKNINKIIKLLEEKEEDAERKKTKECPEGKVRNPKTGRCITEKKTKECPEGKIRNPKTGRCITKKNK